jgi:hypothetical protein
LEDGMPEQSDNIALWAISMSGMYRHDADREIDEIEAQDQSTYTSLGWDFPETWYMDSVSKLPRLSAFSTTPDVSAPQAAGADEDDAQNTARIDTGVGYTPEPATEPADIPGMPISFTFNYGNNSWRTILSLNADGTFSGHEITFYMETGDGYPNGTISVSDFDGKFTEVRKINEYEYAMKVDFLNFSATTEESITNGIITLPVLLSFIPGLTNGDEFRLYLPGRPTADMPEDYISWVGSILEGWRSTPATLPFYGLCNMEDEGFFYSYEPNE